jgi:hypothetical protein
MCLRALVRPLVLVELANFIPSRSRVFVSRLALLTRLEGHLREAVEPHPVQKLHKNIGIRFAHHALRVCVNALTCFSCRKFSGSVVGS